MCNHIQTYKLNQSQHGGQETTALTTIPYFVHQGMTYVPLGFPPALSDSLNNVQEIVGGSAYGAGAIAAGDGSREVTEKELAVAHYQGKNFGEIIRAYVKGRDAFKTGEKNQRTVEDFIIINKALNLYERFTKLFNDFIHFFS